MAREFSEAQGRTVPLKRPGGQDEVLLSHRKHPRTLSQSQQKSPKNAFKTELRLFLPVFGLPSLDRVRADKTHCRHGDWLPAADRQLARE